MKKRLWFAAAVLAAAVPTFATAQSPAAPTAPRPATTGSSSAPADGKVAVINTGVFAEKIFELKSKADTVNKKYEGQFKQLEASKNQVSQLETTIKTQGPNLTPDALQKLQDQYTAAATAYKRQGEDLQAAYNKEADTAIAPVRQKLEDFVRDYASKRGIVLILDLPGSYQAGIIGYFNQAIDITDDFVSEYNRANPVPGAAAAAPARPGGGR